MTLAEWFDVVSRLGVTGLLLLVIYGLMVGWFVTRREYQRILEELEQWRELALENLGLAKDATGAASKATDIVARRRSRPKVEGG
jgi:hypothetical protein